MEDDLAGDDMTVLIAQTAQNVLRLSELQNLTFEIDDLSSSSRNSDGLKIWPVELAKTESLCETARKKGEQS